MAEIRLVLIGYQNTNTDKLEAVVLQRFPVTTLWETWWSCTWNNIFGSW